MIHLHIPLGLVEGTILEETGWHRHQGASQPRGYPPLGAIQGTSKHQWFMGPI